MSSELPISSSDSALVDIDWEQLSQLSEGNSEFELEVLQMFAEDVPIYIEEIETALAHQDLITLKRAAHQIKGSSGNVGAKAMEDLAAKIESSSSNDNLTSAAEHLSKLQAKFATVKKLIDRKYGNG